MIGLQPGVMVNGYRILREVGRGGMAVVYLAHQENLGRDVALKLLPAALVLDPDLLTRFQLEARAVASLRHPAILVIHDVGAYQEQPYLVTEFVDGGTLAPFLGTPQSVATVLRLLGPIAGALDYAHARGLLHRDVKPANILLRRDGSPVLADFGLALAAEAEQRLTRTGLIMGTPEYMAPEQATQPSSALTPAVDRYALAVIAYELLTGRLPFGGATTVAVVMAKMTQAPPPPRTINPAIAPAVEAVLLHGLAIEPEQRYLSATAFVEALAADAPPEVSSASRSDLPATVLASTRIAPQSANRPTAASDAHATVAAHALWAQSTRGPTIPDVQPVKVVQAAPKQHTRLVAITSTAIVAVLAATLIGAFALRSRSEQPVAVLAAATATMPASATVTAATKISVVGTIAIASPTRTPLPMCNSIGTLKSYPSTVLMGQNEMFSACLPNLPNRILTYTVAYHDGTTQEVKVLSDKTGYSKEQLPIQYESQGLQDSVYIGVSYQGKVQITTRFTVRNPNYHLRVVSTSTHVAVTATVPQSTRTATAVPVATMTGCAQSGPVRGDGTTCDATGSETFTAVLPSATPTNAAIATAEDTATFAPTESPTTVPPPDSPTMVPTPTPADTPTDIPTDSPTVPPVATSFAFDDGGDACTNARTAANTVVRFYMAVDERRYASAYGCLSPAWQAGTSLDKWVAGYDTTVASPLVAADQLDATTVSAVLDALDQKNGELIASTFAFRWQLDANGFLTHATDTHHTSHPVDSAPTTYPPDVIAEDGQQIVSNQQAYLTGGGSMDNIYLTDNGSGRQIWIYEGNRLIFAETLSDIQDLQPAASNDGFTIDWSGGSEVWHWTPDGFE